MTTQRQSRRCRSLLDKLKKDQAQAMQHHRFPATSCPICLEDIQPPAGSPEAGRAAASSHDGAGPSGSDQSQEEPGKGYAASPDAAGAASSSSPSAPLLGKSDSDGCAPSTSCMAHRVTQSAYTSQHAGALTMRSSRMALKMMKSVYIFDSKGGH